MSFAVHLKAAQSANPTNNLDWMGIAVLEYAAYAQREHRNNHRNDRNNQSRNGNPLCLTSER
jgi:hypothetical protein